ncbi:MAG: PilN domain-containing protein [Phycisphaerae bacterium]|jgi:Tfp pilus assembly protein PilN|nr:PilN domain-containing protein [Phycisphaerae bacterium]
MSTNNSFLPEDYIVQAAERRTNLVSLVLFGVVMTAVFGAFLVTNQQWTQVRREQIRVHGETERAADDIRKMQELDKKRVLMVDKANLAMTLIEPVPRSVLLALLVNAMPERLSLLDFDLKSQEIKAPKRKDEKDGDGKKAASAPAVANRGKTKSEADRSASKDSKGEPEPPKQEPVKYLIAISMTGVAPTDLDVSRYMNALSAISVFKGVRLETTEEKEVDGMIVRQFKISMRIEPDADLRELGKVVPLNADPMGETVRFTPSTQASVTEQEPGPEEMPSAPEGVAGEEGNR